MFADLASQVAIRVRVAFALGLAERAMDVLTVDAELFSMARAGLDLAWDWERGMAVSPDAIDEYIDGKDDDLNTFVGLNDHDVTLASAIIAVTFAIGYAANHAYLQEGRGRYMSVQAAQCDELSRMDELIENLLRAVPSSEPEIIRLHSFVVSTYPTTIPNSLGPQVDRATILPLIVPI